MKDENRYQTTIALAKSNHSSKMPIMKTTLNSPKANTILEQRRSSRKSTAGHRKAKSRRPALKIQQILVPTDFSEPSKKALKYAVSIAEQLGAKITLLHVFELPIAYPYGDYNPFIAETDKIMPAAQVTANQICKEENINPRFIRETLVKEGISYQEIVETAKALKMDLIIIATHGHTGLAHVLLGSTTERVVRHAPCPVLVVRAKEREFVSA
ncbi:MAG: universal stress protein [Verrucomicrobiota bacterium]|jgi:nucleotide-binding universal stress UspA family protein